MNYISENNEIEVLQTDADVYLESFHEKNFKRKLPIDFKEFFDLEDGKSQYNFLKNKGYALCSPSIFIKKCIIEKVGGFDERFRLIEDLPLWLKITKANIKFYYLPVATVNYRSHEKSIARGGKKYMSATFARSYLFFVKEFFPKKERSLKVKRNIIKHKLIITLDNLGFNNNSKLSVLLYKIVNKI